MSTFCPKLLGETSQAEAKSSTRRKTWIIGRLVFVAIIVCSPLTMGIHENVALAVAFAAIFGVFLFDRMLYFKLVPIAKSKQEQASNPKE